MKGSSIFFNFTSIKNTNLGKQQFFCVGEAWALCLGLTRSSSTNGSHDPSKVTGQPTSCGGLAALPILAQLVCDTLVDSLSLPVSILLKIQPGLDFEPGSTGTLCLLVSLQKGINNTQDKQQTRHKQFLKHPVVLFHIRIYTGHALNKTIVTECDYCPRLQKWHRIRDTVC